jgi:Tfp pilus assembly protein PilN
MDQMKRILRPPAITGRRYWLAVFVLCALTGWVALLALRADKAAGRVAQRVVQVQAAQAKQVVPVAVPIEPAVLKRWKALQAERDFSWGDVFAAVEKAGSEDVELLAFEPDKANRTIQLRGEARDQKALLAFVEALAQQPTLKNVHLIKQQRNKRDSVETLVFEVKAAIFQ